MVHRGVVSTYPSLAYPTKGDDSGKSGGDCDAPRGYTRRRRNINKVGTQTISASQHDDAVAGYRKSKGSM
jgi:hypothetical protein